jgi:plasmid replication initiation protein
MEITLAQANALTQARYDYSVVEKRAIYFIIKEVRRQYIDTKEGNKDLFNDLIVKMLTEDLKKSDTSLQKVYAALRTLRKKDVWIEDSEQVLCVGYINYFKHKVRDPFLEVQVSKEILPYMVQLAEQFTTYSLTVAIALKTKYSQRFYEYCSQYKNQKFFTLTIDELRSKLMLEDKYPRYSLLHDYVIATAHNELKTLFEAGQCDLYFNYTENKAGRTTLSLNITVITREEEAKKEQLKPEDCIFYIRTWLSAWMQASSRPKNKAWIDEVIKELQLHPDKAIKLYKRLEKMQKEQVETNYAAYSRHIIEEDFL